MFLCRLYLAAIRPLRVYVLGLIDLHVEIEFISSVLDLGELSRDLRHKTSIRMIFLLFKN